MTTKKTAVKIIAPSKSLSLASPSDVSAFGQVLKQFIKKNNLSVSIQGKDYALVDGWKFAGLNFGLTAIPTPPEKEHTHRQYIKILFSNVEYVNRQTKQTYWKEHAIFSGFTDAKEVLDEVHARHKVTRDLTKPYFAYRNNCDIVTLKGRKNVSRGTGFCSNLEILKSGFDEYSVISMCETRSIAKAYRNLLGHVMQAADMATTPAEEMNQDMELNFNQEPKPQPVDDVTFNGILKAIRSGNSTLETVLQRYTLSEEQIKTINEVA